MRALRLNHAADHWVGEFEAMASPCQLLVDLDDRKEARRLLAIVAAEVWRIQDKFSRYASDNVVHAINNSGGRPVDVDEETARLLDYAHQLHHLSEGRFDVTSGVLRRVWTFDGGDRLPTEAEVEEVRSRIGWERVEWDGRRIALDPKMQIDLGGIGKEYAADRAAKLVADACERSCLVNLGGDLVLSRLRSDLAPWRVGIESPDLPDSSPERRVDLKAGALATSGNAKRFVEKDGVRYGHVLDPRTGWPVRDTPRSVTVAASTCLEAGMLATFAMLHGRDARSFLEAQGVRFWILN